MELTDYLRVLRKYWATVLTIALVTVALAGLYTLQQPQLYSSTAQVFFSVQMGSSNADLAQGSNYTERQMSSFSQAARSPLVLEPVVEQFGLPDTAASLASKTQVNTPTGTVIMGITVTERNPETAATLANAITQQLLVTVPVLTPPLEDGTEPIRATVLSAASPQQSPVSPNTNMNLALGLIVGLAAGFGIALLREVLDTRIRDAESLAEVTEVSVLGSIPRARAKEDGGNHAVISTHPHSQRAEAIRHLRTNLQFVDFSGKARTLVVTSSVPAEGKSTTILNLAIALSDAGSRVALVDADLRKPTIHKKLGLEGAVGLTTVLIGRASLSDALQPWRGTKLDVLTAGQIPPNPSELLGSLAMANTLDSLAAQYDYVLVDSAPLLPVTDGAVLARQAGAVLLVVSAEKAKRLEVSQALERLENVDAAVAGIVLNCVSLKSRDLYTYGYYGEEASAGSKRKRARKRTAAQPAAAAVQQDGRVLHPTV